MILLMLIVPLPIISNLPKGRLDKNHGLLLHLTQAPSVIYLNLIATGQFILDTQRVNAGVSSTDSIALDHKELEKTEGQKSTMTIKEVSKF